MVGGKFTLIRFIYDLEKKIYNIKKLFNLIFIYNINLILIHMTKNKQKTCSSTNKLIVL